MSAYTIKLSGPIQIYDVNLNLVANVTLTGIQTPVTDFSQGSLSVTTAAAAIPLPASPTNFIYMQNIGTATAVVSWVPQGGAGAIVQNLTVSSAAMVIQAGSAGNTGVTAITVSCAATTTVSYLLGG
jgi:hypothetical protein